MNEWSRGRGRERRQERKKARGKKGAKEEGERERSWFSEYGVAALPARWRGGAAAWEGRLQLWSCGKVCKWAVLLFEPDGGRNLCADQLRASARLITAEEVLQSTTSEPTTIKYTDVFLLTRLLKRKYFWKLWQLSITAQRNWRKGRKGYKGSIKQNF